MFQGDLLGLSTKQCPRNMVGQHSRVLDSLIARRVVRGHCVSPSFWSSDRGAIFCTRYQRPPREAWGKVRRSTHIADPRNVRHTQLSVISLVSLIPSNPGRLELDWLVPTSRVGEYWREGRRLLDRSLGPGPTTAYRRMMEDNTHLFLGQLLETPEDFFSHIGLSVWRIAFCVSNR